MSLKYAEQRIREALQQCKGNAAKARQQVIEWAQQDSRLLQALTQHHLNGIVAYHIERVSSGRTDKPVETQVDIPVTSQPPAGAKGNEFGMQVLKAVVRDRATIFGLETYDTPPGRGKASQRHINAIHQIARFSRSGSKDTSTKK